MNQNPNSLMKKFSMGMILMLGSLALAQEKPQRPVVGAIRWDAWTGGGLTSEVERSLGPAKYHDRMPWFGKVMGKNKVRINGSPPAVMEREIDYAAEAGLDYWAFLLCPESNDMSLALKRYLASRSRDKIGFCVILHSSFAVPEKEWPKERDRAVALLKEPGYQTVLDKRPLVYAYHADRFVEFRQAAKDAGLNPYYVFMGMNGDPVEEYEREKKNGFDAVSAYAYGSSQATFKELSDMVENKYWKAAAAAGVPYVPLVTAGWDKQPRKDTPVSWEKNAWYHQQKVFPSTATPQEIASHLQRALAFVKDHGSVCEANALIMYAWNEHDEGGWLVPTWAPGGKPNTARLDAIRPLLRPGTN